MTGDISATEKRNMSIMAGQGTFAVMGWTMASPSIVLTFLAISLELPVFVAGLLITIRHAAAMGADMIAGDIVAGRQRKKGLIALADIAVAACFLLALLAAIYGSKPVIMAAFISAIFCIGVVEEFKSLMITDILGNMLRSRNRMRMYYTQTALGGLGAIALTWLAHWFLLEYPPLARHSTVVTIAVFCFFASAISIIAVHETSNGKAPRPRRPVVYSPVALARRFAANTRHMLALPWFRHYMLIRLSFQVVGLSIPFFTLLAAESHHGSTKGLTALIISSAAALLIAAPLWRTFNEISTRLAMIAGTVLVAIAGTVLMLYHHLQLEHSIYLHAISLFVVSVAVTGISGARTLHFMAIAPKEIRVAAQAVSKSLGKISVVVFSSVLAVIAHSQAAIWAVAVIIAASIAASLLCFFYAKTPLESVEEPA
ncbi:hypothetical protein [Hoeflea sp. TYP-13]|uniref:hypothetical protein n=1 Tax=Hoeflea sp. TYP-13 TaxID=3230023 RepID=UPI0034C6C22E